MMDRRNQRKLARLTRRLLKVLRKDAVFDEDQHPRDDNGRWTSAGGGSTRDEGGTYRDASGQAADQRTHERMAELKIPPAWTDVRLNPDESAPLQAIGVDGKGRSQYVYSAEHCARAAAEKFERLGAFSEKVPQLNQGIAHDLTNPDEKTREAAAAMLVIAKTGIRVGSDRETQGAKQAYGATTLQAEHVKIDGDKVHFNFTGKKGVEINQTVVDKDLARELAPRVERGGRLFKTKDTNVRDYIKQKIGDEFKPKDYRTWHGTTTAMREVASRPAPLNPKDYAKAQREVCRVVAAKLGNTPAVAKESYIDPSVWSKWDGAMMKTKAAKDQRTDQELMADLLETVSYVGKVKDWRKMPSLGTSSDEPDYDGEKSAEPRQPSERRMLRKRAERKHRGRQ